MRIPFPHVALSIMVCIIALTSTAYAQAENSDEPSIGTDLTISINPAHPSPGERVRISLSSNLLILDRLAVVWRRNGKEISGGTGMMDIEISAGALGEKSVISADVSDKNVSAHTEAVIIPTEIDLLYDANSYVPPFYKGRALPSAGSSLRMQAIAQFKRNDGTLVPESDIVYTWKQNGRIITTISGRGKSRATFDAPSLFGAHTIVVSAVSADGIFSGETSVVIPSVDPLVLLYEDHPLLGVLYNQALSNNAVINDSERTFVGVPHFAPIASLNDPQLMYQWRINNQPITVDQKKQHEITINADNSSGRASIDVSVTHRKNLFFDARGAWNVSFRVLNTPAGLRNPFGETIQ